MDFARDCEGTEQLQLLERWLYDRTVVGYAKLTAIMNA